MLWDGPRRKQACRCIKKPDLPPVRKELSVLELRKINYDVLPEVLELLRARGFEAAREKAHQ